MNKITISFFLLIFSTICNAAHSQYPSNFDLKTLYPHKSIEFTVTNWNKSRTKFQILVNEKPYMRPFYLDENRSKKLIINLKAIRDETVTYNICSFAKANNTESFNLKVCSKAKIYYPYTRIINVLKNKK